MLVVGRGVVGLRRMCQRVADELLLVVSVATVPFGRRALILAFGKAHADVGDE